MGRKKKGNVNSLGYYTFRKVVGHSFDGSLITKVFYSKKSKGDAQRKAEEYVTKQQLSIQLGETLNPVSVNFKNCAYMWLESVKSSVSDVTYNTYETAIRLHLLPYFGKARIQDIKPIDVQTFFDKFDGSKKRLESIKKYKQVLSAVFQFAKHNDVISRNPCDTVRLSNKFIEPTKHVYNKREAYIILRYARQYQPLKDGIAIELMLGYGLRKGEALALTRDDVDFKNNTISINKSVTDYKDKNTGKISTKIVPPKNKFSNRVISISHGTVQRLKRIDTKYVVANANDSFYSPHNWTYRNYNDFMEAIVHKYGFKKLTPHELRHTRATIWVNSNKNLFAVASALGHSDLKMLQERYAHRSTDCIKSI